MLKAKSDKESDEFRNDGNVFYNRNEMYNALMCYNKSLCFAASKEKQALAYANRSAVYIDLKKYKECLMNIQWALRNNYPVEKIQKLIEREEKCKKLMEENVKDPADDPIEFFKLSYPPNPKIPFIIEGLEIVGTEKGKKSIKATHNLKAGDVIAIEDFAFSRMYCSGQYNRCCYCLKVNMMNLIPWERKASIMFCSVKCRNKTREIFKHAVNEFLIDLCYEYMVVYAGMELLPERILFEFADAFGGPMEFHKFIKIFGDFQKLNKTIFDYDWTNEMYVKKYKAICILALPSSQTKELYDIPIPNIHDIIEIPGMDIFSSSVKMLRSFKPIVNAHSHDIAYKHYEVSKQMCPGLVHDGMAISLFESLLERSCMANVARVVYENKVVYIACRPIQAKQKLTVSDIYYHKATKDMRSQLHPNCRCYACVNNVKPSDYRANDPDVLWEAIEKSESSFKNVKKIKEQLTENWKIITANCHDPLSLETAELIMENNRMIEDLAYAASFPC